MRIGNVNRACLSFMEIPGCSSKLNPWPLHTAREEESYPPSKVDVVGDRGVSSSMGDIFEMDGEFFFCAAYGFEKIENMRNNLGWLEAA